MRVTFRAAVLFVTCVAFGWTSVLGQDFESRNKISVRVSAVVSRQAPDLFFYSYALSSFPVGAQNVWDFRIIFLFEKGLVSSIESPPRWSKPMMPVDGPPYWVSWGALGENKLKPGESESGFGIRTMVKPGITDYYAEGYTRPPSYEGYVTDDTLHGYDDLTPYGPGVVGRTVGPVLPPDPFDPAGFLDTLLSYTTQCDTLGWIADQATVTKYAGYFTSAKTSLQGGSLSAARRTLKQVLQDANVDSTSTLTTEAYALIRYNTEYLISKLPDPPAVRPRRE